MNRRHRSDLNFKQKVCKLNDCEATFNLGVWWGQTWMWLQAGQDELGGKELQPKSCQSLLARIQLLILVETYKLKIDSLLCSRSDSLLRWRSWRQRWRRWTRTRTRGSWSCRRTTTTSSTSLRSLRSDTTTSWMSQGDWLLLYLHQQLWTMRVKDLIVIYAFWHFSTQSPEWWC